MSIEEKARAYDEAIEKARKIRGNCDHEDSNVIDAFESIFPELKESEDERIRKDIIQYLKEDVEALPYRKEDCKVEVEKVLNYIAWLEKQKPVE